MAAVSVSCGYREFKLREGRSAPSYINATITRLGTILDVADERELIARNPVRVNPRNRKLRVRRVRRAYLDRPEQVEALLAAAPELDAEAHNRADRDTCLRRPMMATLIFAGLRISETLGLRWRDVDLAGGRLRIAGSKTDAGIGRVPLMPALRDELAEREVNARHRRRRKAVSTATDAQGGSSAKPSRVPTRSSRPSDSRRSRRGSRRRGGAF